MRLEEFDYALPLKLIAQHPLPARDASRMLMLERDSGRCHDAKFTDLPGLLRGDELIVMNNARVIPARLFAHRQGLPAAESEATGRGVQLLPARIEVLLVRRLDGDLWEVFVRPGTKVLTR